jgi:hypothetical protein
MLLLALGALDLVVSGWLLTRCGGWLQEASPLAARFVEAVGWPGLLFLKLSTTAAALFAIEWFGRRRPRLGKSIFFGGAFALTLMLGCSCLPLESLTGRLDVFSAEERRSRAIAEKHWLLREYRAEVKRLSAELIAGRISLSAAVAKLQQTGKARNSAWIGVLRDVYEVDSIPASLACDLIQEVRIDLSQQEGSPPSGILRRLTEQYQVSYRSEFVLPPLLAELDKDRHVPQPVSVPRRLSSPVMRPAAVIGGGS